MQVAGAKTEIEMTGCKLGNNKQEIQPFFTVRCTNARSRNYLGKHEKAKDHPSSQYREIDN